MNIAPGPSWTICITGPWKPWPLLRWQVSFSRFSPLSSFSPQVRAHKSTFQLSFMFELWNFVWLSFSSYESLFYMHVRKNHAPVLNLSII
jgi:hypothetical protein